MNQLTVKNLVKSFVKNFALLVTENSLYPAQHPNVIAQLKQTFAALEPVLSAAAEVYIDIQEGQYAYEGIPFYELKHTAEKTVALFEAKKIKSLCFKTGVTEKNLGVFVQHLTDRVRAATAEDLQRALISTGIHAISIHTTLSAGDSDDENSSLASSTVYGSSIEANKLIYDSLRTSNVLPMDVVDKVAGSITDLIAKDSPASLALATLRDYDEYTFTHSTNVAILSVTLATHFVSDPAILRNLARAGLLHDIGKTKIPLEIVNKPSQLNDEEWQIMRTHPMLGAEILERQEPVDIFSIVIATQHHMRYDMSGYPHLSGLERAHPLSMIVNICDVYDAITSKRPYKKPLPPDKALAIMMRLIGCEFDPQFFKVFTQVMGIYPPGSLVRLNTQEFALVYRVNPGALLLPTVKIVSDSSGTLIPEPRMVDLSRKDAGTDRHIDTLVDPTSVGIDPLSFLS